MPSVFDDISESDWKPRNIFDEIGDEWQPKPTSVFSPEEAARLDKAIAEEGMPDLADEEFKAQVAARAKASEEPILSPEAARIGVELATAPLGQARFLQGARGAAAEQISGLTTPESIAAIPVFAIPGIGEGLGLALGTKAAAAGAGRTVAGIEAGSPEEIGAGLVDVAGGGTMMIPGVKGLRHPTIPNEVLADINNPNLTPEQIADAQRRATNIAAPGTVRPEEISAIGPPSPEKPNVFDLGEIEFRRSGRYSSSAEIPPEILPTERQSEIAGRKLLTRGGQEFTGLEGTPVKSAEQKIMQRSAESSERGNESIPEKPASPELQSQLDKLTERLQRRDLLEAVTKLGETPASLAPKLLNDILGVSREKTAIRPAADEILFKTIFDKLEQERLGDKYVREVTQAATDVGLNKSAEALAEAERKNASTVRGDTGQLPKEGEIPQGGEKVGGNDVQLPPSGTPAATRSPAEIPKAFEQVKTTEQAWDLGGANQTPEGIGELARLEAEIRAQFKATKDLNQKAAIASGPLHFIKEALSAARNETDRPAMTEYFKNKNPPSAIDQYLADVEAGKITATQDAQAFGDTVKTAEDIAKLKAAYEAATERSTKELDNFDKLSEKQQQEAVQRSIQPQMIAEAIEKATGASEYKGKDAVKFKELMDAGQPKPIDTGALGEAGMGGAKPAEIPGRPTIEETIPARPSTEKPPMITEAPREESTAGVIENLRSIFTPEGRGRLAARAKGFLGTMAGETMPKTTIANKVAGEAGARYLSSRVAAPYMAKLFSRDVLTGLNIDPVKFGAALSEDNLRSVRAANPEAGGTFSFVGEGKPFATEAEYQNFLRQENVREAIQRHISNWNAVIEPMYREAQRLDPDVELPTRGEQTGARVNLAAVVENEPIPGTPKGSPRGGLLNTLRRKSPFGIRAKGTGEAYHANYDQLIANSIYRQLEIANKNVFDKALVDNGLAVIDKPGQKIVIGGQESIPFPLQRKIIATKSGAIPKSETIYVRKDLAREYRNAANVDDNPYRDFITTKLNSGLNQAALAGLTDATVHITNLSTALAQLPVSKLGLIGDSLLSAAGRLDIPVAGMRALKKGAPEAARYLLQRSKLLREVTPDVLQKSIEDAFWKNQTQLATLAEIGAAKAAHPAGGVPGLSHMSNVIQWYDRTTRMVLDDAYKDLAERGIVENSETARREFINQVGQYNKRAQGVIVRLSRDLGTGPFVTAGRAFNVLGVRGSTLNPGVKASSVANAAALRANAASKWLGTLAFVGLANYLITGHVQGRKGTPIGSIDTGSNDEQGRMKSFSIVNLTGQGRALRVTGARGAIEAAQKGLPATVAADAAARDVANSWIAPLAGPPVKAFFTGVSGYPPAISVGRSSKVVPPGHSQTAENVKQAAIEVNPVAAGIAKANEPGKTWEEAVKTQLPRFTLQTKQPEKMIKDYPAIVRRAQSNAYIEDVIHRARYIENAGERKKYVREALKQLDPKDRQHAELTLRFRKIDF